MNVGNDYPVVQVATNWALGVELYPLTIPIKIFKFSSNIITVSLCTMYIVNH